MNVPKLSLRFIALGYLVVILLAPLGLMIWRTLAYHADQAWQAISDPMTVHAFEVTLEATAIAVPLNTVFGILCGLAIVRRRFPGKGLVNAFVDLPLAISPVVVGLSFFLLFGRTATSRSRRLTRWEHPAGKRSGGSRCPRSAGPSSTGSC